MHSLCISDAAFFILSPDGRSQCDPSGLFYLNILTLRGHGDIVAEEEMDTPQDAARIDQDMMQVLMGEKTVEAALNLEPASQEPTPPAPAATPDLPKQEGAPTDTPVVLAKDGEHTIPYTVVEGLRDRVQQQAARIAELEGKGVGAEAAPVVAQPTISADDMDLIKEEFPEVAKQMEEQAAKLRELEAAVASQRQIEAQNAATSAQAAIDAIPKLAHIQANNPDLFAEACRLDEVLRTKPENASLSLTDRFQKAMNAVEAMFGEVALPGSVPQVSTPGAKPTPPSIPKPVPPTPNSLSDLPAGAPPIHDPLAAITNLSNVAILDQFHGKTPAQIEEMMARLI